MSEQKLFTIPDFELADKIHEKLMNTEDWCTVSHKQEIRDTVIATLLVLNSNLMLNGEFQPKKQIPCS